VDEFGQETNFSENPKLDALEEILEVTGIHSAAGVLTEDLITQPTFRAPHHTVSYAALVGGGKWPRPGEVSMAHRGVLFLDELPEFRRDALEELVCVTRDKSVTITQRNAAITLPADFLLVAAMNNCPCGGAVACVCTPVEIDRYRARVEPTVRRLGFVEVAVPRVSPAAILDPRPGPSTADVRWQILAARGGA